MQNIMQSSACRSITSCSITFMLAMVSMFLFLSTFPTVHSFSVLPFARNPTHRGAIYNQDNNIIRFQAAQKDGETDSPPPSESETVDEVPKAPVKCPDCDLCDGSGRISGGIGAVLDWWPIKAYRPCPNFIERGGSYTRSGQGLDEIAFGRDSKFDPNQN
mmetsp:Transcript_23717/g.44069  ORF Transcript_23717/g.44069 Transcript_23717/m.44069 type:complete len:160 (+) Transcript_23717:131-610(+)